MDIVISLVSAVICGLIFAAIDGISVDFNGYYNSDRSDKKDRK